MHNLKFRAWDIANKEMLKVDIIDFFLEQIRILQKDASCFSMKFKNVEIMQSTGFHDKNGVEIFEGDVLSCGYLFTGSPFEEEDEYEEEKGVVKFLNCGFNIEFKNCNALFIDIMLNYEDIEVIGNIYENPELLK
jgi:hypothetical protein